MCIHWHKLWRVLAYAAVCLVAILCPAEVSISTNQPVLSKPDSGMIKMGGKTLSVTDVNPLAGTQTLSRVLERIDPVVAEYARTSTTAQRNVVTQKVLEAFKKLIDGQPLRVSALVRDIKVVDDNTAELQIDSLEYDDYSRQSKPNLFCVVAPYGLRIGIPKEEALALKAGIRVVLIGRATYSSEGGLPFFPMPNSKTPFVFRPAARWSPLMQFGAVSLPDPEFHITKAVYRLK
jgi:hypothetical protein